MHRKVFLAVMVMLCFLLGACSREQKQQAASSQQAASEQQKLEQQLAEQQKKLDEQQRKLDEQQQQLAEQQKAPSGASQPGTQDQSPRPSAGQQAASPSSSAAASAPKEPAAPPKPPEPVYTTLRLEAGTPVVVRTTAEMSTKTIKPGDTFAATLEEKPRTVIMS